VSADAPARTRAHADATQDGGAVEDTRAAALTARVRGWPGAFRRFAVRPSLGHGVGHWDVEVWQGDGAWVALHRDRRGEPGPGYAMIRRSDTSTWAHLAVDARGKVLLDGEREDERCASCHREAPEDGVFPAAP